MATVVFICTGNHCRSPMAEAWFRYLCESAGVDSIATLSAGTAALRDTPANPAAVQVLNDQMLSLRAFRGRQLDAGLVREADLLIPMAAAHREVILDLDPTADAKTRLLMSFVGEASDVADPLGGTYQDYADCLESMKPALEALLTHVITHYSDKDSTA